MRPPLARPPPARQWSRRYVRGAGPLGEPTPDVEALVGDCCAEAAGHATPGTMYAAGVLFATAAADAATAASSEHVLPPRCFSRSRGEDAAAAPRSPASRFDPASVEEMRRMVAVKRPTDDVDDVLTFRGGPSFPSAAATPAA